jgi:uncharacterized protein
LRPQDAGAKGQLANLLATSPDATVRDGHRAVALASDCLAATRLTFPNEYAVSIALTQLAAAQAEAGNFDAAMATQREAIETSKSEQALDHLREVLQKYEAKQPYHRSPPSKVP